ncbi:MAG TPA: DUF4381 domain-containing protein [Rhodanobacteraceae bacterium]|jgi:hypothetical protein|nr:DUF4381 domain-containing protein [Rhodanobacteraceae bacterium]
MNAPSGPDLRDIHLPPVPSWWPPAPGWWLLAIVLLIAIAAGVWTLLRLWRERRWRARVVAELDRIAALHAAQPNGVRLAADVSQLLRRAALLIEPGAAGLHGEEWLAFLDSRLDDASESTDSEARFRTSTGRSLIDAPYRRADDTAQPPVDGTALLGLARRWLRRALPRGKSRV